MHRVCRFNTASFIVITCTLISILSACKAKEISSITLSDWIMTLDEEAGIDSYTQKTPYFINVSEDDVCFDAVQAAVDQFGPIDFRHMDEQAHANGISFADHDQPFSAESSYMGGALPQLSDAWLAKADPTSYISEAMAPMLVEHGCMDKLVPFTQSVQFVHAIYQKLGAGRVEFVPLPDADHEDKEYASAWNQRVLWGWLDEHLKGKNQ